MTKSTPAFEVTESAGRSVGVHEAKTHFSELLRYVAGGEEIRILRNGTLVAKLVPAGAGGRREFGLDVGAFTVPDDFNAPMTDEELAQFGA